MSMVRPTLSYEDQKVFFQCTIKCYFINKGNVLHWENHSLGVGGHKCQTKQRFLSVGSYSPLQGRCPWKSVSGDSLETDHPASPMSTLLGSAWIRRMDTISQFLMLFSNWSATWSSKNLWLFWVSVVFASVSCLTSPFCSLHLDPDAM